MDQSLPLQASGTHATAAPPEARSGGASAPSLDEEPDSPGRSPGPHPDAPSFVGDPLSEGLGALAGVAIAALTLLVPLAAVLADRAGPDQDPAAPTLVRGFAESGGGSRLRRDAAAESPENPGPGTPPPDR